MVWLNKGFHATIVAWIAVAASWIYTILYVIGIGVHYSSEPHTVYRPTPVSIALSH